MSRLQLTGIDGHHLNRGRMLSFPRYEDQSGHAVVSGKRQFFDQFFVGYDPIIAGRQDSIYARELKRMMENDGLAE